MVPLAAAEEARAKVLLVEMVALGVITPLVRRAMAEHLVATMALTEEIMLLGAAMEEEV